MLCSSSHYLLVKINPRLWKQGLITLTDMFKKKIKELEAKKKLREIDLHMVHDTPSDPMMAELYRNDLMVELMHIENAIEFEKAMLPFKYMLSFAAVASLLMLIYAAIKIYL
jgi:hypothetical protein